MSRRTEIGVMMETTERVLMQTRPVGSLHQRGMAEDAMETTMTYMTPSVAEMHVAELKTGTGIESVKSKNGTMKGTMITTVLTWSNLTGSSHRKRDISQEASRHTLET
jgi:hypothetical protein